MSNLDTTTLEGDGTTQEQSSGDELDEILDNVIDDAETHYSAYLDSDMDSRELAKWRRDNKSTAKAALLAWSEKRCALALATMLSDLKRYAVADDGDVYFIKINKKQLDQLYYQTNNDVGKDKNE